MQDERGVAGRFGSFLVLYGAFCLVVVSAACATVPPAAAPAASPAAQPDVVSWEDKLGWMLRLEDARIVRDPNPPPPAVLVPATRTRPAIVAPPQPSDLIRLLADPEARVRRRAAFALGRVGLADGVEPLIGLLTDEEVEVRQAAAFALGLLGDPRARPALLVALRDASPVVQGRAAEALGLIGDREDAVAVSDMVHAHVQAGALVDVAPDELGYPLAPATEAARLGIYALARLGSYEALAAGVLSESGAPMSFWWPVAYALQRVGDPRAIPALQSLLGVPGRYTPSFAAVGLGDLKASAATQPLVRMVEDRQTPAAVLFHAIRALASIKDPSASAVLRSVVADARLDIVLRVEALTGLGAMPSADLVDLLLDLISDALPAFRAAALQVLARLDPATFLSVLSGLDPDPDWTVRAAQAAALGTLSSDQGSPRLIVMLQDRDQRVVAAALGALVASGPAALEGVLLERLKADDVVVRAVAARGLGQIKSTAAVPGLIEVYRDASEVSDVVARGAALEALAAIDPGQAGPLLEQALSDREWPVRLRAAGLLKGIGGIDRPADPVRPVGGRRTISEAEWSGLLAPRFSPHAFIETDKGTLEVELEIADAPLTVNNFVSLARKGFFNGLAIHRVVPDFVVQLGDPRGDGEGGPGYTIRDELNEFPYLRGTVGMALDGPDTGGSQFFITLSPQPRLDGRYTAFGHVVDGLEVLDRLRVGDVVVRIRIWDGVTFQ